MSLFLRDTLAESLPETSGGDILIVDDLLANLEVLASVLKARGHRVRAASSGQVALDVVAAKPPEVILLDIDMPGMDGFAVCRALKEHPRHRDIPVIFLTVQTQLADRLRAFREGGADYISKPFDAEEVHMRVRNQLDLFRMRDALLKNIAMLQAGHRRIRMELEAVMHAKRHLLPSACLEMPHAHACSISLVGERVAGDAMHLAVTTHQRIVAYGADSGEEGAGGALLAAAQAAEMGEVARQPEADPSWVVGRMLGDQAGRRSFACCFVDAGSGHATCAVSGRVAPGVFGVPAKGAPRMENFSSGGVIKTQLTAGDRLYLASSGMAKICDARGASLGEAQLLAFAAKGREVPLREALDQLGRSLVDFAHPVLPPLDFSMIAIEVVA